MIKVCITFSLNFKYSPQMATLHLVTPTNSQVIYFLNKKNMRSLPLVNRKKKTPKRINHLHFNRVNPIENILQCKLPVSLQNNDHSWYYTQEWQTLKIYSAHIHFHADGTNHSCTPRPKKRIKK